MPRSYWHPLRTQTAAFETVAPGDLLAIEHAVWRVEKIRPNDDPARTYSDPPGWLEVQHVAGKQPAKPSKNGTYTYTAGIFLNRYRRGRWPACSCCGEPMPCQAERNDEIVEASLEKVYTMQSRMPGCCWGCGDPITKRQNAIRYIGENLDLPGGPDVVFHLRQSCHGTAEKYEERWLAADHSRRRLLTYPRCGGALVMHQDGTTTCEGDGRDPECQGHASHNHSTQTVCWGRNEPCEKGCPRPRNRQEAWGCGGGKRPALRDPDLPQGILPDPPKAADRRPACGGTLLVHRDGRTDCRGGRDDCWDGTKYRHERKKPCHQQSHGCPECETGEGV